MRKWVLSLISFIMMSANVLAQQTAPVAPAQMGITPTQSQESLKVLDNSNTWVPIGTINPGYHTFFPMGAPQSISSALAGMNSAPQWVPVFHAGITDVNNKFLGGTEGRQFAVRNAYKISTAADPVTRFNSSAQLFLANGYWNDVWGTEGKQNAQVLVLGGPESEGNAWQEDVNFGQFCPTDNPVCALATSVLQVVNFSFDENLNPATVSAMVAATWWEGTSTLTTCTTGQTPVYVFARNNSVGDWGWYPQLLKCDTATPGEGTPQVRSFGIHIDQVIAGKTTQYIFAGEAPSGIWAGRLNNNRGAGNNIIDWGSANATTPSTAQEWSSSHYSGPPCTAQVRPNSFTEATGSDGIPEEYVSACFQVWRRVDGLRSTCAADQVMVAAACQQRWQLYWQDPKPPVAPSSSLSGNRGLTYIPGEGIMLVGAEGGGSQNIYAIQPYPACATPTSTTCWQIEYPVFQDTSNSINMTVGHTVLPYNNIPSIVDFNGNTKYLLPQSSYITNGTQPIPPNSPYTFLYLQGPSGNNRGKKLAEAIYLFRNSATPSIASFGSATPVGKYNFVAIPQLFSTAMNGIRDMVASPFTDDCGYFGSNVLNCEVYATGFDDDGATGMYWCTLNPCPIPPAIPPYVPMHNTAWAAKLVWPNFNP